MLVAPAHIWVCASPFPFCAVGQFSNIIKLKLYMWFIVKIYLSYGFLVYHLKALAFSNINTLSDRLMKGYGYHAFLIIFI